MTAYAGANASFGGNHDDLDRGSDKSELGLRLAELGMEWVEAYMRLQLSRWSEFTEGPSGDGCPLFAC